MAEQNFSDRRTRAFIEDYDRIVVFVADAWGVTRDEFRVYSGGVSVPIKDFYSNPHEGHEINLILGRQLDP